MRLKLKTRAFTFAAMIAGIAASAMMAVMPDTARAMDEAALIKAAKAEGEVTWYTAATENVAQRVADKFKEKYGIEVRFLRLGSTPLLQRYATEAEAGNIAADLIITAGSSAIVFANEGIKKGWVESITTAGLPVVDSGEFPKAFNREVTALAQVQLWILAYNTDLVKAEDVPKTWPELLDPKYANQIIVTDPNVSDAYSEFWYALEARYGKDFMTKLAASSPRRFNAGMAALQALSASEGALQAPMTVPAVKSLQAKGAPVDFFTPDFTTGVEMQLVLPSTKSPHPNAGRLLANYLLSKEGNKVLNADEGTISVYDAEAFPKEYVSPDIAAASHTEEIRKTLGF